MVFYYPDENDFSDIFDDLENDVETLADELKDKYDELRMADDRDIPKLLAEVRKLIDHFKNRISDLGQDVSTEIDGKNEYIEQLENREPDPAYDWDDWLDKCLDQLPRKASLGDYYKAKSFLEELKR